MRVIRHREGNATEQPTESSYNPEAIAAAMCRDRKASVRPVCEKLLKLGLDLGPGIQVRTVADMIQLRRHRLFAHFRPSPRHYVDIGLAVEAGTKPIGRLERTGIMTGRDRTNKYRIRVWTRGDVNAEVRRWLKAVYELDWRPRPRVMRITKPLLPMPPKSWKSTLKVQYSLSPRDEWIPSLLAGLKNTTGKTMNQWIRLLQESGIQGRREQIAWLTLVQGLGGITARAILDHAEGKGDRYNPEALVRNQLSGPRAGAAPIYERLVKLAISLGPEVRVTPLEKSVALRRNRAFAQIKLLPWEVGLELILPGTVPATERLRAASPHRRDRITHHVAFLSVAEVNEEAAGWLQAAYEHDALA